MPGARKMHHERVLGPLERYSPLFQSLCDGTHQIMPLPSFRNLLSVVSDTSIGSLHSAVRRLRSPLLKLCLLMHAPSQGLKILLRERRHLPREPSASFWRNEIGP